MEMLMEKNKKDFSSNKNKVVFTTKNGITITIIKKEK